jgi:hypothetical protein
MELNPSRVPGYSREGPATGKLAHASANCDREMSRCEDQRIDAPIFCRLCCGFASVRRELPFNGADSEHLVAGGVFQRKAPHNDHGPSDVLAAGWFIVERNKSGLWLRSYIALRDRRHRLPDVVDQPKNHAVIAKCVQITGVGGDLNNGPCHAIFPLGTRSPPCRSRPSNARGAEKRKPQCETRALARRG